MKKKERPLNSSLGNAVQRNATCILFNPSETARRKDV